MADEKCNAQGIGTMTTKETEQARLLKDARDQLAQRAAALAEKKDKRGLVEMGLSADRAAELIQGASFNTQDLADLLGVSLPALRKWLVPGKGNYNYREMPQTARLLLERILSDEPKKRR